LIPTARFLLPRAQRYGRGRVFVDEVVARYLEETEQLDGLSLPA
jgi:hypothetical protein